MSVPLRRFVTVLFVLALVAGFVVAMLPPPEGVSLAAGRDKLFHFAAFAGFALFGFTVWPTRVPKVLALLLVYGLLIEIAQSATGHRSGDPLDWLADAAGVFAAFLLRTMWLRLRASTA
ncbi:VanZ family protein [Pseudazoarcus pumilus]|uniref:VanZ-like domain-containing protein n=1 Tax=Pseudazoarcus pumilus TaxID=2067960 RepID=A0A2I6S6Q4_9RHOO|nr:VanZ family protein [Pseudazoarcus pumilus]AUN94932.1 hypothetical protein C0099_08285 [Pseudazoarcus pumilus]